MPMPSAPKIYHIVHIDRLASIIDSGGLLCDADIPENNATGTTIGMSSIKQRRLDELPLSSHPELNVGDCVPFYFCPRSVMLYLISRANHRELSYHGGQGPIVHLEADLFQSVDWAKKNNLRWVFTLSNAGACYFEDRNDLAQLDEINWDAVQANHWAGNGIPRSVKEGKQAEFLLESFFPWELVERIGIRSQAILRQVKTSMKAASHKPSVEIRAEWYY